MIEDIFKDCKPTPFEDFYNREEKDQNNFSFWFNKIICPKKPKTLIIRVPPTVAECFGEYTFLNDKTIRNWVRDSVIPQIQIVFPNRYKVFIKNSRFSNKFEFNESCLCTTHEQDLVEHIKLINYRSLECDALGFTELIVREYIGFDETKIPTIYHGMPLRPEYRVFVDFDINKIIHIHDYWDFEYVSKGLYSLTDKIVFKKWSKTYKKQWESHFDELKNFIKVNITNDGLTGVWSLDFLWSDGEFWFIDAARAEQSAYRENIEDYLEAKHGQASVQQLLQILEK